MLRLMSSIVLAYAGYRAGSRILMEAGPGSGSSNGARQGSGLAASRSRHASDDEMFDNPDVDVGGDLAVMQDILPEEIDERTAGPNTSLSAGQPKGGPKN